MILSGMPVILNGSSRRLPDLLQRGAQPRVVGGPHAADLGRRGFAGPELNNVRWISQLPGPGPAPSGGLTTNSRRGRSEIDHSGPCFIGPLVGVGCRLMDSRTEFQGALAGTLEPDANVCLSSTHCATLIDGVVFKNGTT